MRFPDETVFPADYKYEIRTIKNARICCEDWSDPESPRIRMENQITTSGSRREVYPHDVHPVVLAYRRLLRLLDLKKREHREAYLCWLALAMPMDDHDVVISSASKITTAIQEANRMEDLERVMMRLDQAESRMDDIEAEIADDARAQGDAIARSGTSPITDEVGL